MFITAKTFMSKSSCITFIAVFLITSCAQLPPPRIEPSVAKNKNNSINIDDGFRSKNTFISPSDDAFVVRQPLVLITSESYIPKSYEQDLLTSSIRKVVPTQPVAPALPKQHWKIQTGERLSDVFIRWTKASNKWQLVWEAPDLVAQVDVDLDGEFENSVSKIIDALNRNDAGLQAKFYAANRVLRIMEKK